MAVGEYWRECLSDHRANAAGPRRANPGPGADIRRVGRFIPDPGHDRICRRTDRGQRRPGQSQRFCSFTSNSKSYAKILELERGFDIGAGHSHNKERRTQEGLNKLKLAAGLSFAYMLAETGGGWLTNSLALMADAGHMLTDVVAMGLTLAAAWFAERPATERKTYGYYRLEILAAFANGLSSSSVVLDNL